MMKNFITICLLLACSLQINAQEKKEKQTTIFTNLDLVSQHSWRGGLAGDTFSIEPTIELSTGKFTFGVWGAATIDDLYKELDLYISYTPIKGLSLTMYDYYCPPEKLSQAKFDNFEMWHIFDAVASYSFQKIPLKLTCATVIGGMDDEYSTYLEAVYTQKLPWGKNNEIIALVAGTPKKGAYASKADFVNTELILKHTFELKKGVSMPVFGRIVHNPHKDKTYFIFGLSFSGTSLL